MKYLLRLSGEHPELPLAELNSILEAENQEYEIENISGNWHILDSGPDVSLKRCGYLRKAYEYLGNSRDYRNLSGDIYDNICDEETFRIRSNSQTVQKKLGALLGEMGLKVSLTKPSVTVGCINIEDRFYSGIEIELTRDFEVRKPQFRPYFHPTSMHPKLARALVNLSKIIEGDLVLDPFCGTGGILVEAGLMGMKLMGYDINTYMVDGCIQNLKHFGLSHDISVGNALKICDVKPDAIVTDPPYGRSSFTTEDTQVLFDIFIKKAYDLLDIGGRLVLMGPDSILFNMADFKIKQDFGVKMHKSLTRKIWVLEK